MKLQLLASAALALIVAASASKSVEEHSSSLTKPVKKDLNGVFDAVYDEVADYDEEYDDEDYDDEDYDYDGELAEEDADYYNRRGRGRAAARGYYRGRTGSNFSRSDGRRIRRKVSRGRGRARAYGRGVRRGRNYSSDSWDDFSSDDVRRARARGRGRARAYGRGYQRGRNFSDSDDRRYDNCWPNCSDDVRSDIRRARGRGRARAYGRGYQRGRNFSDTWTSYDDNKDVSADTTDNKKEDKVAME